MSIFRREKKNKPEAQISESPKVNQGSAKAGAETSPQKVGVVSAVLPTGAEAGEQTPFSNVVAKRFGPGAKRGVDADAPTLAEPIAPDAKSSQTGPAKQAHPNKTLFTSEEPELETDPMANIGRATTITGNIVAEEDLEIHGTIEGSVRLDEHQVTVGAEGIVKASVEAKIVMVHGKITGDVTAADLIEVKPGGVVGGDVKAPRVIMHDGAIIVGGLDMSAALPSNEQMEKETKAGADAAKASPKKANRPDLKKVELPPVHAASESQAQQQA